MDDVRINKSEVIRRCVARVREDYAGDALRLNNCTFQDAITLNIQRPCEAAIDLAMHEVSKRTLGVPQSSRDAFVMLEKAGVISAPISLSMRNMVGFRNIAVHDYQEIKAVILQSIVEQHLGDFEKLVAELNS